MEPSFLKYRPYPVLQQLKGMFSKQKSISKARTHKNNGKKASYSSKSKKISKKDNFSEYIDEKVNVSKLIFYKKILYTLGYDSQGNKVLQISKDSAIQFVPLVVGDKYPYLTLSISDPTKPNRTVYALNTTDEYIYLKYSGTNGMIEFYDIGNFPSFDDKEALVDNLWDFRITSSSFDAAFTAEFDGITNKNGAPNVTFSNQEGIISDYVENLNPGFQARLPSKRVLRNK